MSSSGSSPAKRALEDFVAGRLPADRLVAAVAGRFYGPAGRGEKEALRPVVELAERSAPGVVSLERTAGGTGFDVRAMERTFPPESLEALRGAAAAALAASWADPVGPPDRASAGTPSRTPDPGPRGPEPQGWFARAVSAVRRLFSAST
jgi:hypothetical protein